MLLSRWKESKLGGLGSWYRGNSNRMRRGRRSSARRGYHSEQLEPRIVLDSTVVFNEVFYNPVGRDTELEWVELHNQMAVDMDLAGWRIDGGIEYDFAEGTILPGGDYLVIAKNPDALALATGFADALGPFSGSLSNGGEELVLYNNFRSFRTRPLPDPPPSVAPDKLWSVDIQGVGGIIANPNPPTKSGIEPSLGLGNIWNNFDVAGHTGTTLNPSAELVDSNGDDSPVTFSITGRVSGWANAAGDPLIDDYLFVSAGNADSDITWEISGLVPGASYEFYAYGGVARDATITLDIDGDGSLTGDAGRIVPGSGFRFDTITASDSGTIIGSMAPGTVAEGNWGGFQLFQENEMPAAAASTEGLPGDGGLDGRRVMDSLRYDDDAPWPVGPDGSGATLAKVDPNVTSNDAANWTTSAEIGGTPGALNFEPETIEQVSLEFLSAGETASVHVPQDETLGIDWTSADYVQGSRGETWSDEVMGVGFFQGEEGVPYQETVLVDDPLVYWRFSATDTQTGATNLGTLGAAVGGTFAPQAMVGADSLIGQAADHSLAISALDTESPFVSAGFEKVNSGRTMEFWVSVDSLPSTTINLVGDAESFLDYGMRVHLRSNGRLIVYNKTSSSFLGSFYDSEREIRVGEVVHVVATWDAVTGESQLFLDGVAAPRTSQVGPSPDTGTAVNTNNPIFVGRDGQGTVSGSARIDEVAVYDYPLGAERVAVHYEAGRPTFSGLFQSELTDMHQVSSSAYVRKVFTAPENVDINHLTLSVTYDDAFVAYLNGEEVARRNVDGDVAFDSTALRSRTLDDAQHPVVIDLSADVSLLKPGENVLAIHGMNVAADDDDFALDARLVAHGTVIPEEATPSVVFNEISPASAETFQLELQNDGARAAQIDGFVIAVAGVTPNEFAIANVVLQPGERLSLSENDLGFRAADGDRIFLYNADKSELLDARQVTNRLRGRSPQHGDRWLFPSVATFGEANSFQWNDNIIINEILYHAYPDRGTADTPPTFETVRLLDIDSTWRYNENRSNAGLPTGWQNTVHPVDDADWFSGPGLIGFDSTPAALPAPINTQLNDPASNTPRIVSYYFETEFEFDGEANDFDLRLNPVVDDGAIFYLNGIEVYRLNMPDGNITPTTLATPGVGDATFSGPVVILRDNLIVGTNRLSVEVHQTSTLSSDIVFGTRLDYQRQISEASAGRPFQERDEEWIEIFNRGAEPVDLSGWSLDGGIDFDFPSGMSIAPDEHFIIAGDASDLSNKYPGLADQIIGEFDRSLSNAGELVMLVDNLGNPADEVRYYDDGRWPESADGRGSSLELRNPFSDNSLAESWAASDESAGTQWQTYSYRGTASDNGIGNNIFHEFVLGLLDSGEVLLDDLSVIEDPSGVAVELLQNGGFESDTVGQIPDAWRLIGTHGDHGQSVVIADPDNPDNQVLRLVTTGPTEDKHNQASTTYANGQRIEVGGEYEISFRAKWITGSNQVNTRLYFNYLQHTTMIDTPTQWGTPGEPNSVLVTNSGPTYQDLIHTPVVPSVAEDVTVSIRADDSDGIASMNLHYSVSGAAFSTVPMVAAGGAYSARIPSQSSGAQVQFYVEGTDTLGATSTFPAAGAASRAMYEVDDGRAELGRLHNVRIVMTPADTSFMYTNINRMSNHRLGATVIYDESEVFYDVGVRLKGSAFGRNNDSVAGLSIQFHPDHLFRGVHETVSIERAGNPKEIVAKHMLNRAAGGLVSFYDDVAHVITPRSQDTGVALLAMARTSRPYLDSLHSNAGDIPVYNMELLYSPQGTVGGNPESPKLNFPYTHNNGRPQFEDLGDDKETYRWNFQMRSSRDRDDYEPLIATAQAFSLTGQELEDRVAEVIDVDQWMRTFAMLSLNGNDDVYTRLWEHNFRTYARPEDGKLVAVPWDLDRAFQLSTGASPWGILNNASMRNNVANIIERPVYTRLFWGHVLDIANTTANTEYMSYWTGHYGDLIGRSFGAELNYIRGRSNFMLGQLPPQIAFEITTNDGNSFTENAASTTIAGRGWVDVREIRLAGASQSLPHRFLDDENWEITVSLVDGANVIQLEAINHQGIVVGTDAITVNNTVPNPVRERLVLSEISYNPADPTAEELGEIPSLDNDDFEFLEFTNVGDQPIDLVNVQITDGVDFVFPAIELAPGEHVLVVQDVDAFRLRYGDDARIAGEFAGGRLNNGGERISVTVANGEEIIEVDYVDNAPWSEAADGLGATLELINGSLTINSANGAVDRWRGSTDFGGTPGQTNTEPVGIRINEILSNTDLPAPQTDAIELFNGTDAAIDISGWYLSDAGNDLLKYQIPAGTVLAAGEFLVFDESDFNPTPASPADHHFSLNGARGDDVWLVTVDTNGRVAEFVDEGHFRAAANGVTFGRKADGEGPLTQLARNTLGCRNSHPQLAPIVISEFSYNPGGPSPGQMDIDPAITADDIEYIELHNVTGETVDLTGWRLRGGVDLDFAAGTTIRANEIVLLISFDPLDPANSAKFDALKFGIGDPEVRYIGGYNGQLSDTGESFRLERPDIPPLNDPSFTPYVGVDEVTYDEHTPWPSAIGAALARLSPVNHAGSAGSWVVSSQPGQAIYQDTDFTGDGIVTAGDVDRMLDAIQQGANHSFFDMNDDGAVNAADLDALLASIGSLAGDTNLDGTVDAADLNQVGLNWQRPNCMTWSEGDFTGDGAVDASDLNVVGLNWLRVAAAQRLVHVARPPRAPLNVQVDTWPMGVADPTEPLAEKSARGHSFALTPLDSHADTSSSDSRPRHVHYQRSLQRRRAPTQSHALERGHIKQPLLDELFANDLWLF